MNVATDFEGAGVTTRLSRLVATGRLPPAAHDSCKALIERLKAPIQIGIFGLPGSGKRHVLNALQGAPVVPNSPLVPTLEVVPGPAEQVSAILPDGATISTAGPLTPDFLDKKPVFLTLTNPMNLNNNMQFLLVVCDPTVQDMSAGLRWAAGRVDVALWCSRSWQAMEAEVWRTAPDSLRDHAVLCLTGQGAQTQVASSDFESTIALSADPVQVVRAVSQTLDQLIADAVTQDFLTAEYFLQRYETATQPDVAQTSKVVAFNTGPQADPAALSELAKLFRKLRRASQEMRTAVIAQQLDGQGVLDALGDLLENLAEDADTLEYLPQTWPELHEALSEARELAVLMRLEGRQDQAVDAAWLLLQLRHDMECKLAA